MTVAPSAARRRGAQSEPSDTRAFADNPVGLAGLMSERRNWPVSRLPRLVPLHEITDEHYAVDARSCALQLGRRSRRRVR
jgi:hypothetical protein